MSFQLIISGNLIDDPTQEGRTQSALEQGVIDHAAALIASLPANSVTDASFSGSTQSIDLTPVPPPAPEIPFGEYAKGLRALADTLDGAAKAAGVPEPELSSDAADLRAMAERVEQVLAGPQAAPEPQPTQPDGAPIPTPPFEVPVPETVPPAAPVLGDPGTVGDPGSSGTAATGAASVDVGGDVPTGPTEPASFVAKIEGESYDDYVNRVVVWNTELGHTDAPLVAFDEGTWSELPVG